MTPNDQWHVTNFRKFLSWDQPPKMGVSVFCWPPAVYAYCLGLTEYCPPEGEM